jgi:hypothetical protein
VIRIPPPGSARKLLIPFEGTAQATLDLRKVGKHVADHSILLLRMGVNYRVPHHGERPLERDAITVLGPEREAERPHRVFVERAREAQRPNCVVGRFLVDPEGPGHLAKSHDIYS